MKFQKGHVSWLKGTKGLIKSNSGSFKKGLKAHLGIKHTEITRQKMSQNSARKGKPSPNKGGYKLSEDTKRKIGLALQGNKSYRWIVDRTKLSKRQERNDMAYKEWRLNVWRRDNFKCKINNEECDGSIEAHHILSWKDFEELRYNINNGITLCHAHHPRKRIEEKRLEPIFQELLKG